MKPIGGNIVPNDATALIGNEWDGFALDFLTNSYAVRVTNNEAEELLGTGPYTTEPGLGISFLDNTVAMSPG